MNHIDATNWTLRFQLITAQLMSFPLWVDTWWSLYVLRNVQVNRTQLLPASLTLWLAT